MLQKSQERLLPVLSDSIVQSAHPSSVPAGNVRPALEEYRNNSSVPSMRCGHQACQAAVVGLVDELRRFVEERAKLVDLPKHRKLHVRHDSDRASH